MQKVQVLKHEIDPNFEVLMFKERIVVLILKPFPCYDIENYILKKTVLNIEVALF